MRIMRERGTLSSPNSRKTNREVRFLPCLSGNLLEFDLGVKRFVGAWVFGWEEVITGWRKWRNEGWSASLLRPKCLRELGGNLLIVRKSKGVDWMMVCSGGWLQVSPLSLQPSGAKYRREVAESWPFNLRFSQYNFYWFGSDSLNYPNLADFLQISKMVLRRFLCNLLCFYSNILNPNLSNWYSIVPKELSNKFLINLTHLVIPNKPHLFGKIE